MIYVWLDARRLEAAGACAGEFVRVDEQDRTRPAPLLDRRVPLERAVDHVPQHAHRQRGLAAPGAAHQHHPRLTLEVLRRCSSRSRARTRTHARGTFL